MFQTQILWQMAIFLVLIGPAIGSFLAVLVDRLPRGEDVVRARSRCRSCAAHLSARDLIPLVSYVFNRARCRHCGAQIPRWIWIMEVAALASTVTVIALWVPHSSLLFGYEIFVIGLDSTLFWVLLTLIATDLRWMRLPDVLTASLLVLALSRSALLWPSAAFFLAPGPQNAMIGAVLGAGSFALVRLLYHALRGREGLGLGDVKLMAGLGALVGADQIAILVLLAALLTLAAAGLTRLRSEPLSATTAFPFGAALASAALVLWALPLFGF